jgi:hypothetical protein
MDLVKNDVDTLHEEIECLVGHLVENDVDTLREERNHLVRFSFIRVLGEFFARCCGIFLKINYYIHSITI